MIGPRKWERSSFLAGISSPPPQPCDFSPFTLCLEVHMWRGGDELCPSRPQTIGQSSSRWGGGWGISTVPAPSSCLRQVFALRHSGHQIASWMRVGGSGWRLFNISRMAAHLKTVNPEVGGASTIRAHIKKVESHSAVQWNPSPHWESLQFDLVNSRDLPGLCGCYFDHILVILGQILQGLKQRSFCSWKLTDVFIHPLTNEPSD